MTKILFHTGQIRQLPCPERDRACEMLIRAREEPPHSALFTSAFIGNVSFAVTFEKSHTTCTEPISGKLSTRFLYDPCTPQPFCPDLVSLFCLSRRLHNDLHYFFVQQCYPQLQRQDNSMVYWPCTAISLLPLFCPHIHTTRNPRGKTTGISG